MSKSVSGPFSARNLGKGAWRFATGAGDGPEVLVQGAAPGTDFAADTVVEQLAVSWRHDGVELALTSRGGVRVLRAASAIVHEPNGRLYQSLPLAGFDDDARRFWRRVFRLIRIPGGRLLLGIVARRRRGARGRSRR